MSETDPIKHTKEIATKDLPKVITTTNSIIERKNEETESELEFYRPEGSAGLDSSQSSLEISEDIEISKMKKINDVLTEGLVNKIRKYKNFTCSNMKTHFTLKEKIETDKNKLDNIKEVISNIYEETSEGKNALNVIKEQYENNSKEPMIEHDYEENEFLKNLEKLKMNIDELNERIEKVKLRSLESEGNHNIFQEKGTVIEHCKCDIF